MITNVLEYLENSALKYPEKPAFTSPDSTLAFAELKSMAQSAGTCFAKYASPRSPIVFFTDKSPMCAVGFMGAVYAGCFYVLIDTKHPKPRQLEILNILNAPVLVTDAEHMEQASQLGFKKKILLLDEVCAVPADEAKLAQIRAQATDCDPLYTNFTSGSTGTPKGVCVSHRSVIDFISSFTKIFDITDKDIIANQAPFDFDVSVKDIYGGLAVGATVCVIPRAYFSFPTKLMDYLCECKATVLTWAVSALCFVTTMKGLDYKTPQTVQKVIFSGEVMPIHHLNIWRKALPNAMYANVYGPTEITCNCLYYILDREFSEEEKLPLGKPFPNETVLVLDENDKPVKKPGAKGEICVAGTCLALGYYGDAVRTAQSFVQNPLQNSFTQTVYRTGDLAYYSPSGELFYAGRKDFQIKHMGHRVELGEIEHILEQLDGVNRVCCLYWEAKQRILAFYDGEADKKQLMPKLKALLPMFMLPNALVRYDVLPITKNGKINRALLLEDYIKQKEK